MVAVRGLGPVGYYKDAEKTASTFRVIDGERYSIPGDYATVEADGTLRLLGRGSVCINTGGEKVFPEEVEEVLKEHPTVRDAVVVGVPDERFGEAISAWSSPRASDGSTRPRSSPTSRAGWRPTRRPATCSLSTRSAAAPRQGRLQAAQARGGRARSARPEPESRSSTTTRRR